MIRLGERLAEGRQYDATRTDSAPYKRLNEENSEANTGNLMEEVENRFLTKASSSAIEGTFNPLTKTSSSPDEGIFIK